MEAQHWLWWQVLVAAWVIGAWCKMAQFAFCKDGCWGRIVHACTLYVSFCIGWFFSVSFYPLHQGRRRRRMGGGMLYKSIRSPILVPNVLQRSVLLCYWCFFFFFLFFPPCFSFKGHDICHNTAGWLCNAHPLMKEMWLHVRTRFFFFYLPKKWLHRDSCRVPLEDASFEVAVFYYAMLTRVIPMMSCRHRR